MHAGKALATMATWLALALLPGLAWATAQAMDRIVIDGESRGLQTNPLTPYLRAVEWKAPENAVSSSANWRGYLATWAIADGRLVLTDVTVDVFEDRKIKEVSILDQLFPDGGPVVAHWYTGALVVAEGGLRSYQHMGYGSTFERYQLLRIQDGVVLEHLRLSGEQFDEYKAAKWKAYQGTDHYVAARAELEESGHDWSEEMLDDFMQGFHAEHYLNQ